MAKSVRPQPGVGAIRSYVPGKPIEEVTHEQGIEDVIKLASNENPLGVSPKALEAMRGAVEQAFLYPDGASRRLREAIAARFDVSVDQVAVGNGADDLILQLSIAYLDRADEVIVSRSSFPVYDIYATAMQAKLIKTPLAPGYRVDLAAMVDALSDRTKLVIVCNPNNPTGTLLGATDLDAFVRRLPEDVLIVLDEAYSEMVDADVRPDGLVYVRAHRANVLVLRTFSKAYGLAGIRLGYAFGAPETIATLQKVKNVFNVNIVAQAAGVAALGDEEFLRRSVEANRRGREQLMHAFGRLGLAYAKSQTNFVLVRIGPRADEVYRSLLERGIIVRPGAQYDLPEFLRVSIGTEEQNERLVGALEELVGRS